MLSPKVGICLHLSYLKDLKRVSSRNLNIMHLSVSEYLHESEHGKSFLIRYDL